MANPKFILFIFIITPIKLLNKKIFTVKTCEIIKAISGNSWLEQDINQYRTSWFSLAN